MSSHTKKSYTSAIILIGILFFIFGFITWANSQLIPYLKIACELTDTQSYYVATAFFAAYFFMAIPSSFVLKHTGFKNGMCIGLLVMAAGALMFIPAANARNYSLFLSGLFVIGTGLALLQTASNPYVTILGPMESAAKRISIMGICNKVAGILAVFILGAITLKDVDALKAKLLTLDPAGKAVELDQLVSKVVMPYMLIAGALVLLAIVFFFIHLPEVSEADDEKEPLVVDEDSEIFNQQAAKPRLADNRSSVFQFPHLILGAIAIFFYVGAEVISYDTFAGFGEHLGFKLETAKSFASYTGWGLLAGYVLSIIAIPRLISQRSALIIATLLSMVLVLFAVFTSGSTAVVCFALLGFSNSVMWPAIWPLSLTDLGKFTKIGSALLIMGIIGGAVLPPLYGVIASAKVVDSRQLAYLMLIPCYLYILYFAMKGYKTR